MPGEFNTATGPPVNGRAIIPVLARFSFFVMLSKVEAPLTLPARFQGENDEVLRLRFESAKLRSE
jgi:hypothetical protein